MYEIKTFNQLSTHLSHSGRRRRAAIVWPEDDVSRQAALMAERDGIITPVMLDHTCCHDAREASVKAVAMAREGSVDVIMKGFVHTDVLLHAVLNRDNGLLRKGSVMTHIAVAEVPGFDRLIFFTDAAVIPYPTAEQRRQQVAYIARVCRSFGIDVPRIALLHCAETVDERHFPYTATYPEIVDEAEHGHYGRCIVGGPLDLKTALSPEAMAAKNIASPIGGRANALVMPDIDTGNLFYKTLTLLASARTAGFIMGTTVPIALPSRGDSAEAKRLSLIAALTL